jgi:hypothetical protein
MHQHQALKYIWDQLERNEGKGAAVPKIRFHNSDLSCNTVHNLYIHNTVFHNYYLLRL